MMVTFVSLTITHPQWVMGWWGGVAQARLQGTGQLCTTMKDES